ncbi:Quinone oxidoreductase 2 [compost metagenome]
MTNFNTIDGLAEAFANADKLALISMPFVGVKRQNAHKNVVDAAKEAGVKQIIYTSLVNARMNPIQVLKNWTMSIQKIISKVSG